MHLLKKEEGYNRVLVLARTRETAENIHRYLNRMDVGVWKAIHANKGQNTRLNAYEEFSKGLIRGVVATDVAARGIDISEVTHVINFDAPVMYTDYVHRVGRTGRAKKEGVALTFVSEVEHYHIRKIQELIGFNIPVLNLPKELEVLETSYEEHQAFAREIDRQKRKEDPKYKGAFHEKKKVKLKHPNKASRKTIQAYKFIQEDSKKRKKRGGTGKNVNSVLLFLSMDDLLRLIRAFFLQQLDILENLMDVALELNKSHPLFNSGYFNAMFVSIFIRWTLIAIGVF